MAKFGNKKQAEESIEELESKYEVLRLTYSDLVEANAKAVSEVSAAQQAHEAKLAELESAKSDISVQILEEEVRASTKISEIRMEVLREQDTLDNIKLELDRAVKVIAEASTVEADLVAKRAELDQERATLNGNKAGVEVSANILREKQKELDTNYIEYEKRLSLLGVREDALAARERAADDLTKAGHLREDEFVSRETSIKRDEETSAQVRISLEESKKVVSALERQLSDKAIEQEARGKLLDLKDKELSGSSDSLTTFKNITEGKALDVQNREDALTAREKALADNDVIVKVRERAAATAEIILAERQRVLEALDATIKAQAADVAKQQTDFTTEKESILAKEKEYDDRAAGLEVRGLELDLIEKKLKAKYALDNLKKDLAK